MLSPSMLIPDEIQGITGLWHRAIKEGEARARVTLSPLLEDHLATTLKSHVANCEMWRPVAQDLATSFQSGNPLECILVGGKYLLIAGFFPMLSERRNVRVKYYVEMGQTAYQAHADYWHARGNLPHAHVSQEAAKHFVPLVFTLRGMKDSSVMKEDIDELALSVGILQ